MLLFVGSFDAWFVVNVPCLRLWSCLGGESGWLRVCMLRLFVAVFVGWLACRLRIFLLYLFVPVRCVCRVLLCLYVCAIVVCSV